MLIRAGELAVGALEGFHARVLVHMRLEVFFAICTVAAKGTVKGLLGAVSEFVAIHVGLPIALEVALVASESLNSFVLAHVALEVVLVIGAVRTERAVEELLL